MTGSRGPSEPGKERLVLGGQAVLLPPANPVHAPHLSSKHMQHTGYLIYTHWQLPTRKIVHSGPLKRTPPLAAC